MKRFCFALVLICLAALPLLAVQQGAVQQSDWEIVRADYGSGNTWTDVTDRVRSLVQNDTLNFRVSGNALGATWQRGRYRTLRLELRDNLGRSRKISYRDNQQVNLQVYVADQNSLHVTRAVYGSTTRVYNVTSRLNSQIHQDQLEVDVNNQNMGGDPAPGRDKTLTVDYTVNGRTEQIVVNEGDTLRLPYEDNSQGSLRIDRATYGSGSRVYDVTSRVTSQVQGDQVNLLIDNQSMGGDPAPGREKTLTVQYSLNGRSDQIVINEGDTLRLPSDYNNNQGSLRIDRATYGSGTRVYDVTSRISAQVQGDQINLRIDNQSMGGDPAPGRVKTLTVQYSINGRSEQVVVNEGDSLRLSYGNTDQGTLQINRAIYGSGNRANDVTARLNSQIQAGRIDLRVDNDSMGGDPAPGQTKTLTVDYAVNGRSNQVVINEGEMLRLVNNNTSDLSQRFRCESLPANNNGRNYCAANTSGGVRFSRNIGDSDCTEGSGWGYDNRGVWVDKGCRAEFELQGNGRPSRGSSSTTIPFGTELSVRTNESIDSRTATAGQTFSALVSEDVLDSSGSVVIPRGSEARLVIRGAAADRNSGSDLLLDVDSLNVNGTNYNVSTDDLERQRGQGVGANRKTAIMVGGGAALGTIIGAIAGGGKGAAIGAAVGAGAGLGTEVLTSGKQVRVPAETVLRFRLDQDLRLQASR